jgi:hypothetical protein
MSFVQTITQSVYGPDFYREKLASGIKGGWKYFFLLILCLAVAYTVIGGILAWKAYTTAEKSGELKSQILAFYPKELAITFQNGEISTNVEEPYIVPMPSGPEDENTRDGAHSPKNLLVIDTGNPIDSADFDTYDTAVIIGKTDIGYRDTEKGKIEIQNLGALKDLTYVLDQESLGKLLDIGLRFLKVLIVALLVLMPFIIFAGMAARYLVYLLFGALVIWGIAALRNVKIGYGQAYRLGLFLITLPIAYNLLISDWGIPGLSMPFAFTLILAVVAWLNLPPKAAPVSSSPVAEPPVPSIVPTPATEPTAPSSTPAA